MRWLHALGVVVAYVVVAAVLLWLDLGDFGTAPPWTVIVAPFFYAVLSLVLVPRATLQRRLRWGRRRLPDARRPRARCPPSRSGRSWK